MLSGLFSSFAVYADASKDNGDEAVVDKNDSESSKEESETADAGEEEEEEEPEDVSPWAQILHSVKALEY